MLLLPASGLRAQQALVFSGGGSRGLAHTGVLFVLPERGYDPDLVVGTSMGAVVGALYAAGYDASEIREQITGVSWRGMFEPTPLIVGHERIVRYPMLTFDVSSGRYRVSRGLVGQWRINRTLAGLLFEANARSRGDFDRLPRRYRAIVADLKTGEAIALDSGDLALAARASMSVPGFFSPVEWSGRIFVDGGIAANLPTGFARRLGATEVIAVDVSRPQPDIHSLAPLAVVQRSLDLMQANTQRDTIKPDALVLPKIGPGFSGANFPDDPTFLIELGRTAAERDLPARATRTEVANRVVPPLPDSFSALVVEAPDSALAAYARAILSNVAPGRYSRNAIARALDQLYASGLIEAAWPRVEDRENAAAPTLVVRIVGQPALAASVAGHFENDRGGRAWGVLDRYGAIANRPAVLSVAAGFETLLRTATLSSRIHSTGASMAAWSLGAFGQESSVRSFDEDVIETTDVLRAGGWAGIELPHILRKRAAIAAVRAELIKVEDGIDGLAVGPHLRWSSVDPPGQVIGIPFTLEAEWRWGDVEYNRFAAGGSFMLPLTPLQLAIVGDVRVVTRNAPPDVQPSLGAEHMIPGLQWGEHRGVVRAAAGVDTAYPLLSGFVRTRLRTGTIADELDAIHETRWISGAEIGVFFPTPLGALDVRYGLATRGGGRFDVSLGQRF